ncbi:MAG: cation:proton antiporter [Cyanobium sp. LacPavin_0818_WC50_MAG_67_9]|nr:cation:proton antiporter [Cyanobium sp. LacPavin_0818_WC50_MAG_67_9]
MSTSLQALLVVVLLTAALPWLQRPLGGRIPTIILYLISGIVVGPALLGWIQPDPAMDILRKLALAAVFAVIGYEFNLRDLAGPMGRLACMGWLATVLSGVALSLCLPISNLARSLALVLPVSASALPNMKFILLGSGEWDKPLGSAALTAGILGQVGPVLALTLLLSTQLPQFTLGKLAVLILLGLFLAALPTWLHQRGISLVSPSAQECFQLILVLFVGILALCVSLDVDILFGGLLAGVVLRCYLPDPKSSPALGHLQALIDGMMAPLFFILAGTRIDIEAVLAAPLWPLVWMLVFYLLRGLPQFLLYGRQLPETIERFRFSLLVSQSLAIPIAVTQMEVDAGLMSAQLAAVIVGGSVLAAMAYPSLAMAIKQQVA